MPDDLTASSRKLRQPVAGKRRGDGNPDDGFDEVTYLRAFPDVLDAVDRGDLVSGREHYVHAGKSEGRLEKPEYLRLLPADEHDDAAHAAHAAASSAPAVSADALILSRSGAILLLGWADDRNNPLTGITVMASGKPYSVWTRFPRLHRPDVGRALDGDTEYPYGFWVFAAPNHRRHSDASAAMDDCLIELHFASGAVGQVRRQPQTMNDRDLRDTVMSRVESLGQPENRSIANLSGLDGRVGAALVDFNRSISQSSLRSAVTERYGPRRSRYRGSVIVPLERGGETLFLQSCLYGLGAGIQEYEFIYIVNQPDTMEQVLREARIAEKTYGLSQTLVLLPTGAGAGAGLNTGARAAQSDRLLFIRPDVFPRDADWARQHTDLVTQLPALQTRLFGTSLYYDNGSIRHAGLYFDQDIRVDSNAETVMRHPDLRIDSFGKGAPAWAAQFTRSRPVPAVSGAFISVDHGWFDKLGGFSDSYQAGQYEDADLCLRSLREGVPPWVHGIRMWQLDLAPDLPTRPTEAGTILNRWLFHHRWASFIVPDLLGKTPAHALLRAPAQAARPLPAPAAAPG